MTVFRCKMCGGDLEVIEGSSICTCEFCGTQQTLPTVKDEGLQTLFNRANVLRMKSEFDKAADIYEKILQRSETEAEAYWGLILCKYGIEYVEDPTTFKRVPTCHRASFDAVTADEDYKNALLYADMTQKAIYESEAAAIDEIQKGIIALAQKADPYDVFICYKETGEDGKRTQDSVIANDIYHQLTQEGFKVFFAAITLEDKLGTEYEPYIFSALNTAKVMLALGTKPEYFNAVWVKNEWSRFLKIMKKDRSKMLFPCYKDMDPYELPEEFAHLQAQDMSKIGFINDLVRGIKKVVVKEEAKPAVGDTATLTGGTYSSNVEALLKRGEMALEDKEWSKADEFYEEVLNQNAECAEAFFGKFLAREQVSNPEEYVEKVRGESESAKTERLIACPEDTEHIEKMAEENEAEIGGYLMKEVIKKCYKFDLGYDSGLGRRKAQKREVLSQIEEDKLLVRARRFASKDLTAVLEKMTADITSLLDLRIDEAKSADEQSISNKKAEYMDFLSKTDEEVVERGNKAKSDREALYKSAVEVMEKAETDSDYERAVEQFVKIYEYEDSEKHINFCQQRVNEIRDVRRKEEERKQAIVRQKKEEASRKNKMIAIVSLSAAIAVIMIVLLVTKVIIPNKKYNNAVALMNEEKYEEAIAAFEAMGDYKDSQNHVTQCQSQIKENKYYSAIGLMNEEKYEEAIAAFEAMGDYKDSQNMVLENKYAHAVALMNEGRYEEAITTFEAMGDYKDSQNMVLDNRYKDAEQLYANGEVKAAYEAYMAMNGYKDSDEKASEIYNNTLGLARSGEEITFGNAKWIVLENEDGKLLVLSKYAVEKRPYNEERVSITWENCTLRAWLNEDYLQTAFTTEEQRKIILTDIKNKDNAEYGTEAGNDTKDKIFILSIDEVNNYFKSDEERKTTLAGGTQVLWWLRSPGASSNSAANVYIDSVYESGNYVNNDRLAVRPAMWIDTTTP